LSPFSICKHPFHGGSNVRILVHISDNLK
jgi:hypothetical protein